MNAFLSKITAAASFALFLLSAFSGHAQTDTLYANNKKIACKVREITPDAIRFSYAGEDLVNTMYKNSVQKIVFKSGRVQTFAEATSFKSVSSVMDFDKVTITSVADEIRGLFKVTDVSAKAKGTTVYSNQEKVKDRAYRKLKIQAAMFGANVIFLSNQRTEGNKYGSYFTSGSTAETDLTGVAYSSTLPDFEQFQKLIGSARNFSAVKKYKLGASDSEVSQDDIKKGFTITGMNNDNGVVYINADLQGEKGLNRFQLVSVGQHEFSVAVKDRGTAYNFLISL